jgi:hypothetical protein
VSVSVSSLLYYYATATAANCNTNIRMHMHDACKGELGVADTVAFVLCECLECGCNVLSNNGHCVLTQATSATSPT